MDHLIYTAYSGLADSMTRQRVIASNMANAQTVGFRAETLFSTPMTLKADSALEARSGTIAEVHGADMTAGEINHTGNALDIAVDGTALIAVQAQDGSEAYTRRGDLSVSDTGLLVNGEGRPVLGQGGPITVPPGSTVSISQDGSVLALAPDAAKGAQPDVVDQIKLASPDGTQTEKGLDGLFRVYGGGVLPADATATVESGALEQSNVNPSAVLVSMLDAQRLFDIRTKLVSTAKDVDESGATLMKMPT